MQHLVPYRRPGELAPARVGLSGSRFQLIEYAYYVAVFYGDMGEALGLSINMQTA